VAVVLGQRAYDGGVDTSGLTEVGFTEIVQWSILIGVRLGERW
jgi:hypothetical protein